MENKTSDCKKTSTHVPTVPGTWYFAQYLVVLFVVLKKAQGSAP